MRVLLASLELVALTSLVLLARCANYPQVFINGNIYLVRVGRKPAQEQNEDGVWVNISDNWVNQVKGFVRAK